MYKIPILMPPHLPHRHSEGRFFLKCRPYDAFSYFKFYRVGALLIVLEQSEYLIKQDTPNIRIWL